MSLMRFGASAEQPEPTAVAAALAPLRTVPTLEPVLRELLVPAMRLYGQLHPSEDREMRITLLVGWSDAEQCADVLVHVADLPEHTNDGAVLIEIDGAPRHAAAAKDSQWLRCGRSTTDVGACPPRRPPAPADPCGRPCAPVAAAPLPSPPPPPGIGNPSRRAKARTRTRSC